MTTTPRTSAKQCKAGSLDPDTLVVPLTLSANLEFELNRALANLSAIAERVGSKSSWCQDILDTIDKLGLPKQSKQSDITYTHVLIWGGGKHKRFYPGKGGAHTKRRQLIADGVKDAIVKEVE